MSVTTEVVQTDTSALTLEQPTARVQMAAAAANAAGGAATTQIMAIADSSHSHHMRYV